ARRAVAAVLERDAAEVAGLRRAVRTLSPASTLERGYAVVQDADGRVLRSSLEADPGDQLRVRLAAGELVVDVEAQVDAEGRVLDPFA
ncbi:exodeoxyribonuclease VII large subunit, partial [Pseudokineococcus marinus]